MPDGAKPAALPEIDAVPRPMNVAPAARPLAIAIAYSRLPLPMTRADQMTVAHLIEFLAARGHAVDFYTLDNGENITPAQRAWLDARCRRVRIFTHGKLRRLAGVVGGLLRGHPLQAGWFANRDQIRAVRQGLAACDVGYVYYLRSAETMRGQGRSPGEPGRPPTFLAMQLSQSLNTRRMAAHYRSLRERLLYAVESRLVRGYEARVWRDFTRAVLIGRSDVDEVRAACRERGLPEIDNAVLGAHGVDIARFRPCPDPPEPRTVAFNGVLRTYTNVDAITWFADRVWPLVRSAEPRARLAIVGRDPRPEVRALARRAGIEVTGEVADPATHIARAAVCVNPVRAAAGMQNKLIEYMAMAKPVVATTVANEGIGAAPDAEIAIADGEKDFAAAILALFADPGRAARMGRAARAFVEAGWTWESHYLDLEAEMLHSLGDGLPEGRRLHGP